MDNIYCTLFNINYLDKGIVLFDSLSRVCKEFKIYVLAMDDKCYDILCDLSKPSLIPVRLEEFENDKLREAKNNRSFGEYCWTCSSSLIKYVLTELHEPICTYIDADMCFYEDPAILIQEMLSKQADVLVVGHRFNSFERKERERISGKYCVEFNTFLNTERARDLLYIWVNQCLSSCSSATGEGSLGDQMYLTNWCSDYVFVIETENWGAGVAPWNIKQYKMLSCNDNKYELCCHGNRCKLIFYHFENLEYKEKTKVKMNVYSTWGVDSKFVNAVYGDYLSELNVVKDMLQEKYGLTILLKRHPVRTESIPSTFERMKNVFKRLSKWEYIKHYIMCSIPEKMNKKKDVYKII